MLAELMRLRYGIAVAGAHGKTTTTSMVALVLERAGLDPTAVIGGRLSAFGSNARLGRGDYMVAEADESDRSFLKLSPTIAVITNIDHEHMESYGSFDDLQQAFVDFANKVPFYGAVVACADDRAGARAAAADHAPRDHLRARPTTAGRRERDRRTAMTARGVRVARASCARDRRERHADVDARRRCALQRAGPAQPAERAGGGRGRPRARRAVRRRSPRRSAEFRGAERRFELRGEADGVMVVDDYGHHPTEIAAVLAAARAGIDRAVVVVFQPHRYTRTRDLMTRVRRRAGRRRRRRADRHLRGRRGRRFPA